MEMLALNDHKIRSFLPSLRATLHARGASDLIVAPSTALAQRSAWGHSLAAG
ncbi:hypothetical protein PC129_g8357 [Phytophthora cactorum]|uniref:Uncharacterized protein n=1 Tax=Phytophthora cactorum TaxID=29920 RepID=A0A8T1I9C6_9STRA|nr:hypothetical protein Pcac1_g12060 [Phytophthora cactorum]KAG3117657.1 hypothetical protein PI125_g3586 [Phytophthora idaei]KAG2826271.1 hypothetical protein PC111_g9035 [Phytophthora cactorum]KAG2857420.1 hypothetical protein PC113_g10714 [Phytophthora cactorum]KAG2906135.1 hypothetical protein PC114_g11268 [Phytophthora cactorum]